VLAERLMDFFSACLAWPVEIFPELTESERKVLRLMAGGANNEAIAWQLTKKLAFHTPQCRACSSRAINSRNCTQ